MIQLDKRHYYTQHDQTDLYHGERLIQISTIGSLQHATMLQCDEGIL